MKDKLIEQISNINDDSLLQEISDFVSMKVTIKRNNYLKLESFVTGDQVKIIDSGEVYSAYSDKFKLYNFKYINHNPCPNNYKYLNWTVIGTPSFHDNDHIVIVPIQSNLGHQLLISINGIKKVDNI